MRSIMSVLLVLTIIMVLAESGHAVVYLNRRLIECDPITYVVEPLEIAGTNLYLDRSYQNDYGGCIDAPPGPPFILEMPVIIENEYDSEGTVVSWGSLIIENRFGSGDPFVINIQDYTSLVLNGNVVARGKEGDPIIFKNNGSLRSDYSGGGVNIERQEYTLEFSWCEFKSGEFCDEPSLYMRGGNLILENCNFTPTIDQHGITYYSLRGAWDVTMNNCVFTGISHPTTSANVFSGLRNLDINNVQFYDCTFPTTSGSTSGSVLEVGSVSNLKNLKDISGSGNSHNWVRLNNFIYVNDSCTIKTSNDFTLHGPEWIKIDTNGICVMDKGTVIQMSDGSNIDVYGQMIMDSAVLTASCDGAYGIYVPGWSRDIPYQPRAWYGIDVDAVGSLEMKNGSLLHWAESPIEGSGRITVDHSTVEQCWGKAIDMYVNCPTELEVRGSILTGGGIRFFLEKDSAAGRVIIDSNLITRSGGDGIYMGGGQGWPYDDRLDAIISNNVISGNGGSGFYGYLAQPTDSLVIFNNRFISNGGSGFYVADGGCDSLYVRLENNVCMSNTNSGISIKTGLVEAVGNTCAYNGQMGISYPYYPINLGTVANNILVCNDRSGLSCYAKRDGIVLPIIAHNVFWQNYGEGGDQLNIQTDDFTIATVPELQALGGVAVTNDEFSPAFPPVYRDVIRSHQYDSTRKWTTLWVDGDDLEPGQLTGLAILPSHRDTTAWYYVLGNSSDTIYVSRDLTAVVNNFDTLTVYDYHLTATSPAIDFGDNDYVIYPDDIDGDTRILDSDEDGSELVDAGADEFNPDSTSVRIWIARPSADTTLVPGETYKLSWATRDIAAVDIDYTFDIPLGGQPSAWLEVARNVSSSIEEFNWEVPAIQSARCMIRISDASNPDFYQTSQVFHVKEVRLTRFAADSTYEFFRPSVHGWSYPNTAQTMWPQLLWDQIDYISGIDPYTGQQYPSYDTAYPFGANESEYFPSWPLWVETFNTERCYQSTSSGLMYVMRALYRWDDHCNEWYGSCVGLSTTALLAFGNADALAPRWGYLNLPETINQVPVNDDCREFINVNQTAAYGQEQMSYMASGYETSVTTTLANIRKQLLQTDRDDAAIVIGSQQRKGSHAMLPYAIVSDTSASRVRVMVYDPDHPGSDSSYVLVDTVAATWYFSGSPTWGGTKNFFTYFPVRSLIPGPDLIPVHSGLAALDDEDGSGAVMELYFAPDADIVVYDESGDSVVCSDAGVSGSISEVAPIVPMDVDSARALGVMLPDQTVRGTVGKARGGIMRLGCYRDSLYAGYRRVSSDTTEIDHFVLSDGLSLENTDMVAKTVQMRAIRTLPDRERTVVMFNLDVSAGDTIEVKPLGDTGWYLANRGMAGQYHLWLREVSNEGERKFYSRDVPIGALQSHILTPNWTTLNADSCTVYIDNDYDMVADDFMVLMGDVLVGVEDDQNETLPYQFAVSQNYPNPFNPITTIEYSLPERSLVRIDIYNVLGQKIRTLVDREESAGSYTITWDGTTSGGEPAATGVYLYRFQAGDHIETKKMLLLK